MIVEIHSAYADGYEVVALHELPEPPELTEDFWDEAVFPLTGDGNHPNVESTETATILDAANQTFIGESWEWEG